MTDAVQTSGRIEKRFAELERAGRSGFVAFITAGDPDPETSLAILEGLPAAGVDLIEIGMPFTDPMADGPAIQASSLRALKAGQNLIGTLEMVRRFRAGDEGTPVVLMGYYNPIYSYGVDAFLKDAREAGVDGLIIVDLPPEEDDELCLPAMKAGLSFIRLATPTTDDARLPTVLTNTSGFVYYVAILGITGTRSADNADIRNAVDRLKRHTDLPVAVGFGIKTPAAVADVAGIADAAVVGSAIVERIRTGLDTDGKAGPNLKKDVLDFVAELAAGSRRAVRESAAE